MERTITIKGSQKAIEKAIAMMALMDVEVIEAKDAKTTQTTKAKAETKPAQTSKKSDDKFDRAKYEALSKEFNCWSDRKKTCYKKCRDTVYSVMNGSLSKAKGKAKVKEILKDEYGIS